MGRGRARQELGTARGYATLIANVPTEDESAGLTSAEAARLLAENGPNRLPEPERHPALALLGKLNAPVPWMLEATLVLEAILHKWIETAIVAVLLVFNAVLAFSQEQRAQSALDLLRKRLAIEARVRRDGRWTKVHAEDLVAGDVIHVRMGDFVPADLRLHDGEVLLDTSSLTGESMPTSAAANDTAYSGSVVRRGEATGVVTATGASSRFGKTAELVRGAKSESHLASLVLRIVKALVAVDAALAVLVLGTAVARSEAVSEVLPFVLMLLVASVPVALPATFTLASALGALDLVAAGVLVTRLHAVEDAAAMQVLCSDKTGTLTENRLSLASVAPRAPFDRDEVLRSAALASDEATEDPLDLAILRARGKSSAGGAERLEFIPFDPATKRSEALVRRDGETVRVVKGAPQVVGALAGDAAGVQRDADALASEGQRVLAVASGACDDLHLVGLLGFLDPPRADAAALIRSLNGLGVRVVMVTGDAEPTARAIGKQIGLPEAELRAGVLPEDKMQLVRTLQREGAVVGMTGDGVNDAPALGQAEFGVAVEGATDVAKAAASIVLTQPGLAGVVAAIETGRRIYQRMLTYTLNKIAKTIEVGAFLTIGFLATATFVTTPRLVLLLLLTNDFVTMSIARDRVTFSTTPDRWDVRRLVTSAGLIGLGWLVFSLSVVTYADRVLHMPLAPRQTLAFLALVLGGQANVYVVRERRHFWSSRPGGWMLAATAADLVAVSVLAVTGTLMAPVPLIVVLGLFGATLVFMVALDAAKSAVSRRQEG